MDSGFSVEVIVVLMFCRVGNKAQSMSKKPGFPEGGDRAAAGRGCEGLGYLLAA